MRPLSITPGIAVAILQWAAHAYAALADLLASLSPLANLAVGGAVLFHVGPEPGSWPDIWSEYGVEERERAGRSHENHNRLAHTVVAKYLVPAVVLVVLSALRIGTESVGVVNLCLDRVYLTSRGLGGWASGNTFPPPFLSAPNILDGRSRSCATCIHYACVYTEERRVIIGNRQFLVTHGSPSEVPGLALRSLSP